MDGGLPQSQIYSDSFSAGSSSFGEVVTTQDVVVGASRSQQPSPRNPFKPKGKSNQLSIFDSAEQSSSNLNPRALGNMNSDQLNKFNEIFNSQKSSPGQVDSF